MNIYLSTDIPPTYESLYQTERYFAQPASDGAASVEGNLAYWVDQAANGGLAGLGLAESIGQDAFFYVYCIGLGLNIIINPCSLVERGTKMIAESSIYYSFCNESIVGDRSQYA
jgi:hypothetical protein